LKRHAEALADWDRALQFDPGSSRLPFRAFRAVTLANLGEHVRATEEANALAERPGLPGGFLYQLASTFSLCVAAVAKDSDLPPAGRDKLAGQYAARAVELLMQGRDGGLFKNPSTLSYLKKDPSFAPLRGHADFHKLLQELETKPKK
jgi:hypothetical protein